VVVEETTLQYLVQDQRMVPAYHHLLYTRLRISRVGGPAGCMYSVSDSGWMESAIICCYLLSRT
jgi:hypothetical protein